MKFIDPTGLIYYDGEGWKSSSSSGENNCGVYNGPRGNEDTDYDKAFVPGPNPIVFTLKKAKLTTKSFLAALLTILAITLKGDTLPNSPSGPNTEPDPDNPRDDSRTPLYRAVNPQELADLFNRAGLFALIPGGQEHKDFAFSKEDAIAYGKLAAGFFHDGPYTVVGTTIPTNAITPDMMFNAADLPGGMQSVAVPQSKLSLLTPAVPMEQCNE